MSEEELKQITSGKFEVGFIKDSGMRLVSYGDGKCECALELKDKHLNPYGSAHGGIIFALADTTGGTAAISAAGQNVVTVSSSINYIGPAVNTKEIIAKGEVIHLGNTTVVVDVMIYTAEGKKVAKSTLTFFRV